MMPGPEFDESASAAIHMSGVNKSYGELRAVRDFDLTVPPGATYGLLGPNGAGKTTTIRILLQILAADTGTIEVYGQPVDRNVLDGIGYLPEERGIYRRMNVRRLLSFMAEIKGVPPAESAPRIQRWLERLDLADRADERVEEMSKGMQQKLQFIACMLHEPQIVILDEPFSGLDVINQRVLKDIVAELKRQGRTILFCTHMIEQAERICDHVCILARGRKVVDGPVRRVKQEHGGTFVALTLDPWSAEAVDAIRGMREVADVREHGRELEVTLSTNSDAQRLLEHVVESKIGLMRFERVEPSLEQVFVDRVGEPDEADDRTPAREVAHV